MEGGVTGAGTEGRRNQHLEGSCRWSFQETAGNCREMMLQRRQEELAQASRVRLSAGRCPRGGERG